MWLYIIFNTIKWYSGEKKKEKKVHVKVDQAGMPFAVPRLQSKLAYIWTTLRISAAAPRWHTHVHCRTHAKGTVSGARGGASLSNHNSADGGLYSVSERTKVRNIHSGTI